MRKILRGAILACFVSCVLCGSVSAASVYYTNDLGVEMTELQYHKMLQIFSERRVKTVTQEEFDMLKDATIVDSDAIYQKTTYANGEVIKEEFITEEEYNSAPTAEVNMPDEIMPYSGDYKYVETTYKKLGGTLSDLGNRYNLTAALSWKRVPVCRSYDVFAYRFNHFNYSGFAGNQTYYINGNYNNISYSTSSEGYKAQSNGAGVSMNLVDGSNITGYELTVTTSLTVNTTGISQAHAYVSYQHAQHDVTRAQSMGYTLDISGLGNVILFSNSSIAGKYDDMSGIHLIASL